MELRYLGNSGLRASAVSHEALAGQRRESLEIFTTIHFPARLT